MGVLLSLSGMMVGVYVVMEWLKGVTRVPLTILTVLLIMMGFEIFVAFLQAYIFSLLSAVYIEGAIYAGH
jgi:F0F1-type ATP synthase membrane subunit a